MWVFQFFLYKANVPGLKALSNSVFQTLFQGQEHERCRKSRHVHLTGYLGAAYRSYQSRTTPQGFYFFIICSYLEVVTDLLLNSLLEKVQGLKRMAEPHE